MEKEQVVAVHRLTEEGWTEVFNREVALVLLEGLQKVRDEIEEHTGDINRVFNQVNSTNIRSQFVEAEKGIFRLDLYDDGSWQVLKPINQDLGLK